ncbi:ribonuclease R [Candidatus Gracilibacteria bacterium]|nr:MAG: ribonuclease R [Candidatus Gracilibacteria bacterium]
MKKIIGVFEESKGYGFVIPNDKREYKGDYYINQRNTFGAKNGDLVEIEVLKTNRGKSKEAKIVNILSSDLKTEKKGETIVGIYSQARDGEYGFIDVIDLPKGYFVHPKNKLTVMDGDTVEAIVKTFNGRQEAEILRIIERKKGLLVGVYKPAKGNFGFVIPKDKNIKNDIFVASTNAFGARDGDIVGVELTKFSGKNPEGVIKEIISRKGNLDKREEEVLTLAVEGGARITFPNEVQAQLDKISEEIPEKELEKRRDLRKLFTFTIDGADAKDLDDAISVEKKENGDFILYVSIADVSHYIPENSALDKEALERGTSIYLADRVIPMLPEKLSNNLCSLNPYTDKLALTCEMHIGGKTGHTVKSKVYESIINSDFRLTYEEIDKMEDKRINVGDELMFRGTVTKELLDTVNNANILKELILAHREKVGILNFDFPETYVSFDEKGEPDGVKEYPKYNSNKLIEVFMVSANEAVAKEFSKIPFLYRIHEEPKDFDIKELENKLQLFGVKFKFKDVTTLEFGQLLEKFKNLEETKKRFLEKMTLRTLTQAMYSDVNFGHFGLGLQFYSHFTSPIRRYPDLQIHRIIKEYLNKKYDERRKNHYASILGKVAKISSDRERLSEKLEYKVRDYFIVKYYKNKVGQEFDAVISGLISKGFFVALPDTAEGFVELKNSQFDEKMQTHRVKGKNFTLGQDVKVRLVEADETLLRLDFEIVGFEDLESKEPKVRKKIKLKK